MSWVTGRALASWVLTVLLLAVALVLSIGRDSFSDLVLYSLLPLTVATVGALIVSRHPRHRVGWIFVGFAIYLALAEIAEGYGMFAADVGLPGADYGAWVISWSWTAEIAVWALVAAIFPDGHVPDARWRWVPWAAAVGAVVAGAGVAMSSFQDDEFQARVNPFLVEGPLPGVLLVVGAVIVIASLVGGTTALVLRLRHSHGVEREQLKWFAIAATVVAVAAPVVIALWQRNPGLAGLVIAIAFNGLPIAAGIAILRYRLYDIDLVIKRTIVYTALTAILVATYVMLVLLLQAVLRPWAGESDLAVAVSTLGVAALFRPLRSALQGFVDRRFFRSSYDVAQTLDTFADRLRHELDLEALGTDLRVVVDDTMQPEHVSLWLRDHRGSR